VEVVDLREDTKGVQPLQFHKVSVLSRSWQIKPLRNDKSESLNNSSIPSLSNNEDEKGVISPNETITMWFRIIQTPISLATFPSRQVTPILTCTSSSAYFSIPPAPSSSASLNIQCGFATSPYHRHIPALAKLLDLEKRLLIYEEKQKKIVNPAAIVGDVDAPDKLDLVLSWSTPDRQHFGFYHLAGSDCMRSQPNLCALKVAVDYETVVRHDFSTGCVRLTVHISVRNRLQYAHGDPSESNVGFLFEALNPEERFDSSRKSFKTVNHSSVRSRYMWQGPTRSQVKELPSQALHAITLFACFYYPGVYNLNRFKFTVKVGSAPSRVFFFPLQHLVEVYDLAPLSPKSESLSQSLSKLLSSDDSDLVEEPLDVPISSGSPPSVSSFGAVSAVPQLLSSLGDEKQQISSEVLSEVPEALQDEGLGAPPMAIDSVLSEVVSSEDRKSAIEEEPFSYHEPQSASDEVITTAEEAEIEERGGGNEEIVNNAEDAEIEERGGDV